MSYEMMEALVVSKIAGIRASEAMFARSLQAARNGGAADLNAVQQRLDAQLHEVEQLLEAMELTPSFEAASIPSFVVADVRPQVSSPAWM